MSRSRPRPVSPAGGEGFDFQCLEEHLPLLERVLEEASRDLDAAVGEAVGIDFYEALAQAL